MIFFKTYVHNCHMAQQLGIFPIDEKILYNLIHHGFIYSGWELETTPHPS